MGRAWSWTWSCRQRSALIQPWQLAQTLLSDPVLDNSHPYHFVWGGFSRPWNPSRPYCSESQPQRISGPMFLTNFHEQSRDELVFQWFKGSFDAEVAHTRFRVLSISLHVYIYFNFYVFSVVLVSSILFLYFMSASSLHRPRPSLFPFFPFF